MAQFDDLMGIVIDTEDKFLNRKLNENICYFGPFAAADVWIRYRRWFVVTFWSAVKASGRN